MISALKVAKPYKQIHLHLNMSMLQFAVNYWPSAYKLAPCILCVWEV